MELLRKDITLLRSKLEKNYLLSFKESPPTISIAYEARHDLSWALYIAGREKYDNFRIEGTPSSVDVILTSGVCNHQELEAIFSMLEGNTLIDMMIKSMGSFGGPLEVMADVAPMLNSESMDVLRTTHYPISNLFRIAKYLRDKLQVYEEKGYPLDLFMSGDHIIAVDIEGEQSNPFSAHDAIIYHYDGDDDLLRFLSKQEIYCERDDVIDMNGMYKTYISQYNDSKTDRMNEILRDMSDLCKLRLACSLTI